jgi:hypothetical protein
VTAAVVYVLATLGGSVLDPTYSQIRQHVSDLTATGASTWRALVGLYLLYNLLAAVFAVQLYRVSPGGRLWLAGTVLLLVNAFAGVMMITLFREDLGGVATTDAGIGHLVFAGISSLAILVAAFCYGFAFRRAAPWRGLSIFSLAVGVGFAVLGPLAAIATAQKSDLAGLAERGPIGLFIAWLLVVGSWTIASGGRIGGTPRRISVMSASITGWSDRLAWLAVVLAASAAAAGLLVADLYRDNDAMIAQARGADLGTLVGAVPVLATGLWLGRRGSIRGRVVGLGALGFLAYNYAIYAFSTVIGAATPVHIAILGLATWALVLGAFAMTNEPLERLGTELPRRTTAAVLGLIVILFGGLWLSQIVGAITSGVLPTAVSELGIPANPVYALDLAFALPVLAWAARALARGERYGPAAAIAGLVFGALMAVGVLGLAVVQASGGLAVEPGMVSIFVVILGISAALAGLGLRPAREARGSGRVAQQAMR